MTEETKKVLINRIQDILDIPEDDVRVWGQLAHYLLEELINDIYLGKLKKTGK